MHYGLITPHAYVLAELSDCFCLSVSLSVRLFVCPWQNSAVGISERLNNFYTWQKHIASVDLRLCVLDNLNLPVCWRTSLEKSLVWTPFSAMRSLVPRLLLPKWQYRGSRTGSALLEMLAPRVRDASPWSWEWQPASAWYVCSTHFKFTQSCSIEGNGMDSKWQSMSLFHTSIIPFSPLVCLPETTAAEWVCHPWNKTPTLDHSATQSLQVWAMQTSMNVKL